MNIGNLYDELFSLVNQHQSGKNYKPDRFNLDIPFVFNTYLKAKYGLDEVERPNMYFEKSQKITDDLSGLKIELGENGLPLMQFVDGKANKPVDYWHYVSGRYEDRITKGCQQTPKWRPLIPVTSEERDAMLTSVIQKPTHRNPVISIYSDYLAINPIDIQFVRVTYLRKPKTPFYDYDIINDQEVFLPAGQTHVNNSVQPQGSLSRTQDLEVPDDNYDDVVFMLLERAGIRLNESSFYQAGQVRKKQGD